MDGKNALNLLKDRRILVIIIAVIIIVAAVAYVVLSGDDDGGSDNPSDGLTITGEQTFSDDRVIEGTLTIEADGKLTLTDGAEIRMLGADAKIEVLGTLDALDGTISFVTQDENGNYHEVITNGANETRSFVSTGTSIITANNFYNENIIGEESGIMNFTSGAYYVQDGHIVVTSVAAAASAAGDVTVCGTVSQSGTSFTISGDRTLTIAEGANVTLGTITISSTSDDADIIIDGALTATVSYANAGSVALASASGIEIDGTITGSGATAETEVTLSGVLSGKATVSTGQVFVDTLTVDGANNTLEVAEGAKLNIGTGSVLTAGINGTSPSVSVLGEILMDGGTLRAPSADSDQLISVAGTMTVLSTSTAVGNMSVTGSIVIGEKPTDLTKVYDNNASISSGSITFASGSYVKVYGDGTFTMSTTGSTTMVNTVFHIDGLEYMTVYTLSGSVEISDVLAEESVYSGETPVTGASTVSNWNASADFLGDVVADNKNVGESGYTNVYFYQSSKTVSVTFDIADGATLTIGNNVSVTDGQSKTLVVGNEYDFKVSEGFTATYGSILTEGTFTPASATTTFVVSATTQTP